MTVPQSIKDELRRIRERTCRRRRGECAICGTPYALVPHHEDYFAPREILTLCNSHHQRRHRRLKERGRDPVSLYIAGRLAGRPAAAEALPPPENYRRLQRPRRRATP